MAQTDATEVREIELTPEDAEAIFQGEIVEHEWPDGETSAIVHAEQSDRLQTRDMSTDFMVEVTHSEFSELGYGKCMVSEGESGHIYVARSASTPSPDAEQVAAKWEQNPDEHDYAMVRFEQL